MCKADHVTPGYIHITVNGNNTQSHSKQIAVEYRINQELKFQYIKKQKLNQELYLQWCTSAAFELGQRPSYH
jgi:hypothetical protein